MISIDEAFLCYEREISSLQTVETLLSNALWRVLSQDVQSQTDLPPFPQSAMDGYALRAQDVERASAAHPIRLRLAGEIPAGRLSAIPGLAVGDASRIFTGGYVPHGADAILRQEEAQVEGDHLLVRHALPSGTNLRARGEEIPQGEILAGSGTRLTPGHLAALAMGGMDRVWVHREPRLALLTTGDEVVLPGRPLAPGEVYDSNTALITNWLRAQGYTRITAVHLPDELEGTVRAIQQAARNSDLLITAGGISVGDRDFIMRAAEKVGAHQIFWRVRQKPGQPLFYAQLGSVPLVGLPGNPGSVFACLVAHVRRVLDLLEGTTSPGPHFLQGRLSKPQQLTAKREGWVRCRVEISPTGEAWLIPLPRQSSHMITNLTECNALARLPEGNDTLPQGSLVSWMPCSGFL